MRTFIAVDMQVGQELSSIINKLRADLAEEQIKWVDFNTFHLTLAFLGETSVEIVKRLERGFLENLTDITPFSLNLRNIGTFGTSAHPTVIWIGVEPSGMLQKLYNGVSAIISAHGFVPDDRGFNPHVTLGRVKRQGNADIFGKMLLAYRGQFFQSSKINKVVVYQSALNPKGTIYTPLYEHYFMQQRV